jgi:hypothetical protein
MISRHYPCYIQTRPMLYLDAIHVMSGNYPFYVRTLPRVYPNTNLVIPRRVSCEVDTISVMRALLCSVLQLGSVHFELECSLIRTVTNPCCALALLRFRQGFTVRAQFHSLNLSCRDCRIAGWISRFSDPPSCSLNVSLPPWNQIERGRSVQSRKHAGCDGSEMPG